MEHEPITDGQVMKLLGDLRAGRRDLSGPLSSLVLVSRECRRLHLAESAEGRWVALTELVGALILNKAALALDTPPQRLRILAEKADDELFALLRRAHEAYSRDPNRLGWPYLYLRFIAPCRLQHKELERRVRGAAVSTDTNAFWNHLKNKVAGPTLTRSLNQLEAEAREQLGPRPAVVSSLPAPEVGLVGRHRTRQLATEAILAGPLVTLAGPGGIGKTSLALQLAWSQVDAFPDGVRWLELSKVASANQLPTWLWQALGQGHPMPRDPATGFAALLRGRKLLLVMDNCEHLLPAVAELVAQLIQGNPDLRILATSRRPLKLGQERVLRLRGLAVPPEGERDDLGGYDAVRAFAQEAARQNPAFALTEDTAPIVAAIVRRVEGLPLALKLIAPWTRHLSLTEILDRFDALLARGADLDRNLPDRHRTLDACLRWSLDGLAEADREVFIQLAVFRGGWASDAVAAVCQPQGGPLDDVASIELVLRLVDVSLVEIDSSGAHSRGRLLEPIRGQCLTLLNATGHAEALRERHAAYFLALAEAADADRERHGDTAWLAMLDRELPNLQAAMEWAGSAGRLEPGLRLATAVWRHHLRRGLGNEAMAMLERGLQDPAFNTLSLEIRARALNAAGSLALLMDRARAAEVYLLKAADLLSDITSARLRRMVLHNLGSLRITQNDLEGAGACFESAMAVSEPGSERFDALTALNLAILALTRSDPRAAMGWLDRSESYFEAVGDRYQTALCLSARGQAAFRLGHGALARCVLADAAEQFRAAGDARRELEAQRFLADAALHDLDLAVAASALERATALEAHADDRSHSTMLSILLARHDLLSGDAARAAERLRRLRLTVDAASEPDLLSVMDLEQAWALAALGLRQEAGRLADCALAQNCRHEHVSDYTIEVLEAVARCTDSRCGPRWLADLTRIRERAGLPRMAMQAARCGDAAPGVAAGAGAEEPGDWRTALTALREEVAQARAVD